MHAIRMRTRVPCRPAVPPSCRPPGWPGSPVASSLASTCCSGEGESQRSGRRRPSLLASSFEALTGALYLDLGYELVHRWLQDLADPELSLEEPVLSLKSPKSRLQEYTQRRSGERPDYRLVEASGPDHEKSFRVEVWIEGEILGAGEGPSRRTAETSAAAQAIERIRAERAAERAVRATRPDAGRGSRRADRRERQRRPA